MQRGEGIKKGAKIYCELELRKGRPCSARRSKRTTARPSGTRSSTSLWVLAGKGRRGADSEVEEEDDTIMECNEELSLVV